MLSPQSCDKDPPAYRNHTNPIVSFNYPSDPARGLPPQIVYCPTIIQYPPTQKYQAAYSGCIATFSVVLGVLQIIAGCISSGAGSVCYIYEASNYNYGAAFWSGAFFVVAGCVAISAGRRSTDYLIKVHMFVCPATIIFAFILFGLSLDGVWHDLDWDNEHWQPVVGYYRDYCIAGNSILIAVASFEILISTVLFAMCVHVVCCAPKSAPSMNQGYTNYTMPSYPRQLCPPMYSEQQVLVDSGLPNYVSVPHPPPNYSAIAVPQGVLGSPVPTAE